MTTLPETQSLGAATIATTLPDGEKPPTDMYGVPISPLVTADFSGPPPTNEFYSSLLFPHFTDPHSGIMHANPLSMKANAQGLEIGHADAPVFIDGGPNDPASDSVKYEYRYGADLQIGVAGLNAAETRLAGHGDWTATADWSGQMQATFGHGLPFVYVTTDGLSEAVINLKEQIASSMNQPMRPLTYTLDGLDGQFDGTALKFQFPVDAGTSIANGIQARISYDFDGNGTFDRVETYHFFPTDAGDGWEFYTDSQGLHSANGAMADLAGGRIKVELWQALGDGEISLQTDSPAAYLDLPFTGLAVDGVAAAGSKLYLQGGATPGGAEANLSVAPGGTPGIDTTADVGISVPGWNGPGTVWHAADGVVGLTVNGTHYGVFGPSGSDWTFTSEGLVSDLGGKDYFSIAVLPDPSVDTLLAFHRHAYAFVTDSITSYSVDQATGQVQTHFEVVTTLMEQGGDLADTPLLSLYRHQYINSDATLLEQGYASPRGEMRLMEGTAFTTVMLANPLLPALPFTGNEAVAEVIRSLLDAEMTRLLAMPDPIPQLDTYWVGKELARLSELAQIAHQVGHGEARDLFLATVKDELADWFDATDGTAKLFHYNAEWSTLQGYPASFASETQINDHQFHYGYFVQAAATVAEFEPDWAAQGQYREIVNEIIADVANWDRGNTDYPFLRTFDPYAGHGWASGHGGFGSGNNQESSSESLNFSAAVARWGAATGQDALTELGLFLHTVESVAVQQYWFDVDGEVFPPGFPYNAVGMVWGDGGDHRTWFSADPEMIRGINFLPINGSSLFLAEYPEHVLANVAEIEAIRGGEPLYWKDLIWQYLALADPQAALARLQADPGYVPEDGASRAHTLHWIQTLDEIGVLRIDLRADTPFAAAFEKNGEVSYIAYNAGTEARTVTFSDGTVIEAAPRSMVLQAADGSLISYDYASAGGGLPGTGDPGPGDPVPGDPDPGDPDPGDPGPGDPGPGGELVLSLGSDGRLMFGDGGPVELAAATGYAVNAPQNALVLTLDGLTGSLQPGQASGFTLALDAGSGVANGTQVRLSYDFNGDGVIDRVESFDILPTDDLPGFQLFASPSLIQQQGAFADFTGGSITVEIWNAFGSDPVLLDPASSSIHLPFQLELADAGPGDPGPGDPGPGDPGPGDPGPGDPGPGDPGPGDPGPGDPGPGDPGEGDPGEGAPQLVLGADGQIQFGDGPAVGLAAAEGYAVNLPHNALTLTLDGLTGTWLAGQGSSFTLALDAGTGVANGTQMRLSYDFDGDGVIDRFESFDILATDDVAGFQNFAAPHLIQAVGGFSDFTGGSLTVEIWNAFGSDMVMFDPAASSIWLPFDLALGGGDPDPGPGDPGPGDPGPGDPGPGDPGPGDPGPGDPDPGDPGPGDPGPGDPGPGTDPAGDFLLVDGMLQLSGSAPVDLASANGGYFVHNPTGAVSFTAENLTGSLRPGEGAGFEVALDAGTGVANGTQVMLSYDFNGDGSIDRTELYDILPTDDLPGFQSFGTTSLLIAEGEMADFTGGSVTLTVWNAFGTDGVTLDPAGTRLSLPHDLDGSGGGVSAPPVDDGGTGTEPEGAWTLYLAADGGLAGTAAPAGESVQVAAAGEGGAAVFGLEGLTAEYAGGTVDFSILLDAGFGIGNGVALELAFDFDGDGVVDRVEEYAYFATNDLPGFEVYAAEAGLLEVSGSGYQDFTGGSVTATVRTVIGGSSVEIGLGAEDLASMLLLPYQGGWLG